LPEVPPPALSPDERWDIVRRWQEYAGESRANLLRVAGIAAFYAVHLANYRGLSLGWLELPRVEGVDRHFHLAVTALALAWAVTGSAVLACLRNHIFPPALKYLSTAADMAFLTAILLIADGPRSPVLAAYFPLLLLSGLRFSLPLVRFATAGAMLGYLVLLGHAAWLRPALRVPRYQEILVLLALGLTGVVLGQVLRRARVAAEDFARRYAGAPGR